MNKRNLIWLFFIGISSLFPLILKFTIFQAISLKFDWREFFKWGELFAITVVICVGCIGEIIFSEKKEINKAGQAVTILLLILISLFSSVFYALDMLLLSKGTDPSNPFHVNLEFVKVFQLILYFVAIITGTFSRNFSI